MVSSSGSTKYCQRLSWRETWVSIILSSRKVVVTELSHRGWYWGWERKCVECSGLNWPHWVLSKFHYWDVPTGWEEWLSGWCLCSSLSSLILILFPLFLLAVFVDWPVLPPVLQGLLVDSRQTCQSWFRSFNSEGGRVEEWRAGSEIFRVL